MLKDKVGASIVLAFCLAYGAMALRLPRLPGDEAGNVTPSSLPIALCVAGIVTSTLMLVLPTKRNGNRNAIREALKGLDVPRAIYLLLLMVGYGLTLKPFGFLISTVLFLGIGFRVMGERRIQMILPVSIGVTVAFWFILTRLLNIYLEPGFLFY